MQHFYFHTGQRLILDSVEYAISRILENKDVVLQRKTDLGLITRSMGELIDSYGLGLLKFVFKGVPRIEASSSEEIPLRSLDSFTESQQKAALRKLAYVHLAAKKFGDQPSHKKLCGYIELFADKLRDSNPPSSMSVYRWWKAWYDSGKDVVSLVSLPAGRFSAYAKQYKDLFFEVIDEVLMTPEYGTKQDAFNLFQAKLNELNSFREVLLEIPSQATFYRQLDLMIDPYELEKAQKGKRAADKKFRVSGKGPKSTRILERVEIDHTPIDLMVVDDRTGEVVGRPTLTVIIDHFSRMPLGLYLGFEPPSAVAVMRAIRHAIMPKSYVKDDYPEFENEWPAYGIFWVLVCDNGSEFHDQQLRRIANELNIELFFCPKQNPHYKGTVERFLGSLNRAVCHNLTGTTRSNIFERDNYDAVENAKVSLADLRRYIHDWIINIYNVQFHQGLGDSPLNVWNRGLKELTPTLPISRERLDLTLTKEFDRIINHEGVSLFRLKYNSHELGFLRRQVPEKKPVKVRLDPEDMGQVWVFDELEGNFFAVPAVDPEYAKGLSLRQHEHILKNRQDTRKSLDTPELLESKVRFKEELRVASKSKKLRKRNKVAQLTQLPVVNVDQPEPPKKEIQLALLNLDDIAEFDVDWEA
jgi:putative transposase